MKKNTVEAQEQLKKSAALAVLDYIPAGIILGVGTGSTVNYFIDALQAISHKIDGAVASSAITAKKLRSYGICVIDLNDVNSVNEVDLYIDGADEINSQKQMIKGGGGALTREKILATVARKFICIIDQSKQVDILGNFPIAIEVIPMARSFVAREIVKLGGYPMYRENVITDNGNVILDVHGMKLLDPIAMEKKLNNIPGIITNGIFAMRPADHVLTGTLAGVTYT